MTQATRGVIRGKLVGVKTGISDWSQFVYAQLPARPSGPKAPSNVAATAATESIVLTWTAPTQHVDGSTMKTGELAGFRVYWSETPGIDITNAGTYNGKFSEYTERYPFTVPDPSTYLGPFYFVITAVNSEGGESAASAEVSATASAQTPGPTSVDDWSTGNIESVLVGKGRIFLKFRLPKTSWNRFSYYKVYYDVDTGAGFSGSWTYIASETIGYMHSPLNESYLYKYKVTVVGEEDGTETTGTIHDNAGAGYQPNASDQSAILADTIAAQHVIAQYDMITQTFIGGTLHSLNWGASAGTELSLDDEVIRLGGSGVGYNSGTGVWIGNDAGTYKLFVGDSTGNKLTFDGSTLSIQGTVTIGAGSSGVSNLADAGALATLDVVGTAQISNLAVTTAKIDDLAVTGAKIADATITNAKIADLAVTSAKIADAAIDTAKIGNLAVTNIKLSGSITYDKIQSISLDSVVTGTLTSDYIVVNNDINFHPGSTWHSIMGCAYIEGYHSGTDIHSLRLGDYSTTSVLLKAGTNASLTLSPTGVSTLKSAGQLRLWTGDGTVYFDGIGGSDFEIDYATTATGNCNYAGGSIRVQIGGVTRRIKLWKI